MNEGSDYGRSAPARLRTALKARQEMPTAWFRHTWERTLPDYLPLLSQISDEVRRADLFAIAHDIETENQALNVFVAAMVWGHGKNGYGAWRTARVLEENPDAGSKLLAAALETRGSGGPAGFDLLARGRLKYLGVAFATKYLFFCGLPATRQAPLILDAVIQRWLGEYANMWLRLDWNKQDYRKYLTCLGEWAEESGSDPATLEEAMFRDRVTSTSQFTVDADRDVSFVLDELDELLAVELADREISVLQEALGHVDALRHLLA